MEDKKQVQILIAEDDPNFGMMLERFLSLNNFQVLWCKNGNQVISVLKTTQPDLCILDVMMPYMDGFSVAEHIQKANLPIPFIFLTAKSMKEDIVKGYETGAVDYLVKPFDPEILLLKVKALLLHQKEDANSIADHYDLGSFVFNPSSRKLSLNETEIKLSPKEAALLLLFCQKDGQTLTRNEALVKIWGEDNYFTTKSMDVYVTRLRKILRSDKAHHITIENLHRHGFLMRVRKRGEE